MALRNSTENVLYLGCKQYVAEENIKIRAVDFYFSLFGVVI